ncbi:unnamed protein product [Cyclocybe aegerita]|uniref:RRM domain-containing protein n=1 Tax=Cyclocybe aegerita TaxID=1973307 RepID=A0A8S0XYR9_CYCAE|nr:unnamed protein product [Cyclocybe aegerita]
MHPTATAQNHTNHTRTPITANHLASQVQAHSLINTHTTHTIHASNNVNNISTRRDMPPLPPTPPADIAPRADVGEDTKSGVGGEESPRSGPSAARLGAQSFASVVSSPPGALSPKSPSAGKYQQPERASRPTGSPNATTTLPLSPPASGKAGPTAGSPTSGELDNNNSIISSSTSSDTDDALIEQDGDHDHDQEYASNSSSDVEIYLNAHTLGLHDSAARMHMHVPINTGATAPPTSAGSASASGSASNSTSSNTSNSGGNPAASMTLRPSSNSPPLNPPSTRSQGVAQGAARSTIISGLAASQHAPSNTNSNSFGLGVTTHNNNASSAESNAPKALSPLPFPPPQSTSPSSQYQQQSNASTNMQAPSTHRQKPAPGAPMHGTIPLPDVDECEHHLQQLQLHQHQQNQHQQQMHVLSTISTNATNSGHAQGPVSSVHAAPTIDLAGLAITSGGVGSGGFGLANSGLYAPGGLPASQSQPLPSLRSPYDNSGAGAGFPTSVSESALCSGGQGQQKTPNVYINGLPPHFPEDELFELASKFGMVRSVRTFTRHVRDSESGYGFVLFDRIEDAERCINELRKDRDLHPTFSKQVHKIPGTIYGQAHASTTGSWESGHASSRSSSVGDVLDSNGSFKAKMESLQDPTSTNLYMEGLPLSIDEPTLAALVSPHRIISSRFFQTRLSNPPRIIAFVRLDTRAGAEEIIEKLHGRMVRGWNDTGSRISVRFADTSEQRELRRNERSAQEGDGSPARLTIAQAALLNLRGQDIRPKANSVLHAHGGLPASTTRGGFSTSVSAPDFSSNAHVSSLPPVIGMTSNALEVDYSLAPGRAVSRSRSPYHGHQQDLGHYSQLPSSASANMDPAMAALLDSLRANGVPYNGSATGGYSDLRGEADYSQGGFGGRQQVGHGQHYHGHQQLPTSQSLGDLQQYSRPAPAYTRSGYTATEEYIMRAHAETAAFAQAQAQQQHQHQQINAAAAAERRRPAPLDLRRRRIGEEVQDESLAAANISVGVRGYRAQASIGRVGQGLVSPPMSSSSMGSIASMASSPMMGMGTMSASMSEDDFHSSAADRTVGSAGGRSMSGMLNTRLSREQPGSAPASTTMYHSQQLPRPMPISPLLPSTSNQEMSPNPNDTMVAYQQSAAQMHMRSTTLPQQRTSSIRNQQQQGGMVKGHYQHNSLSMPAQPLRTPQHASVAKMAGSGVDGATQGVIYEGEGQEEQTQREEGGTGTNPSNANMNAQPSQAKTHYSSAMFSEGDRHASPISPSPSLISPTLTYSSQTPSTLSPATPFFGSFSNTQATGEGFEVNANSKGEQQPQQRKASVGVASGLRTGSV